MKYPVPLSLIPKLFWILFNGFNYVYLVTASTTKKDRRKQQAMQQHQTNHHQPAVIHQEISQPVEKIEVPVIQAPIVPPPLTTRSSEPTSRIVLREIETQTEEVVKQKVKTKETKKIIEQENKQSKVALGKFNSC